MLRLVLAAAAVLAMAGCLRPVAGPDDGGEGGGNAGAGGGAAGGSGGGATHDPDGGSFACDVNQVLQSRCQDCHSAVPRFGAPMPLVTWADTQVDSPTHPGQKMYQRMAARVADDVAPMPQPPNSRLTPEQIATFQAWAAASGPAGWDWQCEGNPDGGLDDGGVPDAGDVGPSCPAGSTRIDIVAPGFTIPSATDFYQCFSQRVTLSGKNHVIKLDKLIDDARVLHHVVLFRDLGKNAPAMKGNCGIESDWQVLYAWGPGAGPLYPPADVGLPINDGDQLVIQIHYNNATHVSGTDSSGAYLCATTTLRAREAGVMAIGPTRFDLPPNCAKASAAGDCRNITSTNFEVFTVWPHMHLRGRALQTTLTHGGQTSVVTDRPNYSFGAQYLEPANFKFSAGDVLNTRCTWDTTGATGVTSWGENTTDEMCFNFLYLVPPPPVPFCPPITTTAATCLP